MLCGVQQRSLPPLDAVGLDGENWSIINRKMRGAVTVTIGSRVRDFTHPDSDELFETAGTSGVYSVRGVTRRAASNSNFLVM